MVEARILLRIFLIHPILTFSWDYKTGKKPALLTNKMMTPRISMGL